MSTIGNIFEIQPKADYTLLRFFGYIDASTVEQLRPSLQDTLPEKCGNLVLDLQRVDFLDSHGVGFFVSLLKRAHKSGGKLVIAGIDGQPATVLQMVGFNKEIVTFFENADSACASLEK